MSTLPIHILIVEDDVEAALELRKQLELLGHRVSMAHAFEQALTVYRSERPDVLLADIFLNEAKTGIDLVNMLQSEGRGVCPTIFLTNMADRATFNRAKLSMPHGYLLKPYNPLELSYSIELALGKASDLAIGLHQQSAIPLNDSLFVKKKDALFKIALSEIEYVSVADRYCELYADQQKFVVQMALKDMLNRLPMDTFIRVHRNYILNFSLILSISTAQREVKLQSGAQVPVSKRYLKSLKDRLDIWV